MHLRLDFAAMTHGNTCVLRSQSYDSSKIDLSFRHDSTAVEKSTLLKSSSGDVRLRSHQIASNDLQATAHALIW
jgi:hypothetical protein